MKKSSLRAMLKHAGGRCQVMPNRLYFERCENVHGEPMKDMAGNCILTQMKVGPDMVLACPKCAFEAMDEEQAKPIRPGRASRKKENPNQVSLV